MKKIKNLKDKKGNIILPITEEAAVEAQDGTTLAEKLSDLDTIRANAALGSTAYQKPNLGIPASDLASGVVPENVVQYSTQVLTLEQKEQVRANIGAASQDDMEALQGGEYVVMASLPTASASTVGKIYLIGPDGNQEYARYITSISGSTYSWVPVGNTTIPSPTIVDNLDTNDASKALSAKQGKYLGDNVKHLLEEVDGEDDYSTTITKQTVAGTKIELSEKYDVLLKAGKVYTITATNITPVSTVALYTQDANGDSVQSYWGTSTTPATNKSFNSEYSVRTLTPIVDVYKLALYATSSQVTGSGELSFSIVGGGVEGISDKIASIQEDLSDINDSIEALEEVADSVANLSEEVDSVENEVNDINIELEGIPDFSETVNITIGESGSSFSTFYPLSLAENVPYIFSLDFGGCATSIRIKLYDSEDNAVSFYRGSFAEPVEYTDFSSTYNPRTLKPTAAVAKIAGYVARGSVINTGTMVVSVFSKGQEGFIDSTNRRLSELEGGSSVAVGGDVSGSVIKDIIKIDRPYYFNLGWSSNEEVTGYLDNIIRTVPKGKHFLAFADIHLDYVFPWNNTQTSNGGLKQKQAQIMRYVYDRLGGCKVVFLGDFIGSQATENGAIGEMDWFANEYYSYFGKDFVFALGDHDTNHVSGGIGIDETIIYNKMFLPAFQYDAVKDSVAESCISGLDATEEYKTALYAWNGMHYYVDDHSRKIRFISFDDQAIHNTISTGYTKSGVILPFIGNAIHTAPDDYDIVICCHECYVDLKRHVFESENVWERQLFDLLAAFENRRTFSIKKPKSLNEIFSDWWDAIVNSTDTSFNFAAKTGRAFVIMGDKHYDDAFYVNGDEDTVIEWTPTFVKNTNDVLLVLFDRACMTQRASSVSNTTAIPYARSAENHSVDYQRYQTTKEVLFDIVTVTQDGRVVCTRVGDAAIAGSPGLYPIFNSAENYSIGDIVVYNSYAYRFISDHAAGGEWDVNEVELYPVTGLYVRQYSI